MTDKLYGWRGKVLWVDLAAKTSKELDISDSCEDYLGARGFASRLAWKYLKPGTGAFDDGNLLMFFNGPCTGTLVPGTGKGYVFGVGPQTYPEHFTRSSMGGRWPSGLKSCGYDGLILENKCSDKVILEVTENGVEFHDAIRYWGHDTQDTQYMLKEQFGEDIEDAVVIGPAGENHIRFATIMNLFNNVSGQGGFGAVMGDKKVKAIMFNGSKPVAVPDHDKIMEIRQHVLDIEPYEKGPLTEPESIGLFINTQFNVKELKAKGDAGEIKKNANPCRGCGLGSEVCTGGNPCAWSYKHVPPTYNAAALNGVIKCVEPMAWGWNAETKQDGQWITTGTGRNYRWPANFRAGTEVVDMWNRYGFNGWEGCSFMMWFSELESIGIDVSEIIGMDYNVDDDTLWQRIIIKIIKREGFGNDMAEGIARFAEKLGSPYKEYSTHAINGYCDHGLGTHCYINLKYPYWIVNALLFATDVRDPLSDGGHRYYELTDDNLFVADNATNAYDIIAKELWGSELAIGPKAELRKVNGGTMDEDEFDDLAYSWKEHPAAQIQQRSVIVGSGIFCDGVYPRYRSNGSKKYKNGDPIGDFDIEAKIMSAVTGVDYTTRSLEKLAERVINIERCYNVLEFNRNKAYDMTICDNIQPRGDWTTGKRIDKERFSALLGRYYALRGWDENGIPTEGKLLELGLDECNEKMKAYR
ncbi:MAG: aldehyde ferredoxin oxidoreductase N-terminal domain-containing protein [Syntrophomonas sp.]